MLAVSSVEVWPWAAGAAHRQGRLGPRVGRGFPGVGQVVRVRRTRTTWGRKSADEKAAPGRAVEVTHPSLLAAMTRARPEGVAAWVQGCWKIENRLHWVRDVVFDQGPPSAASRQRPEGMAAGLIHLHHQIPDKTPQTGRQT